MWFEWLMVAVGLVLTVGTGFFVASEPEQRQVAALLAHIAAQSLTAAEV